VQRLWRGGISNFVPRVFFLLRTSALPPQLSPPLPVASETTGACTRHRQARARTTLTFLECLPCSGATCSPRQEFLRFLLQCRRRVVRGVVDCRKLLPARTFPKRVRPQRSGPPPQASPPRIADSLQCTMSMSDPPQKPFPRPAPAAPNRFTGSGSLCTCMGGFGWIFKEDLPQKGGMTRPACSVDILDRSVLFPSSSSDSPERREKTPVRSPPPATKVSLVLI